MFFCASALTPNKGELSCNEDPHANHWANQRSPPFIATLRHAEGKYYPTHARRPATKNTHSEESVGKVLEEAVHVVDHELDAMVASMVLVLLSIWDWAPTISCATSFNLSFKPDISSRWESDILWICV